MDNNANTFIILLSAGIWEKEVRLLQFGNINFEEVYRLAEEQSVMGLVAAGIEHVVDIKVPQEIKLSFAGNALQSEQRNFAMNEFMAKLIERMRESSIDAILVKGQGVARCYSRVVFQLVCLTVFFG